MIYFTKTYFRDDEERQTLETALRKVASKRHGWLDFKTSSTDIGTEKRFLGFEEEKHLNFTRLRTSFERMLPKLIVSFPKSNEQGYYKIRFSFFTSIVLGWFSIALLLNFYFLISGITTFENVATVFILFIGYLLLVFLELKITTARIKRIKD